MEQLSLEEAERRRDDAIARSGWNANDRWWAAAREEVILAAIQLPEFTTDVVWRGLDSRGLKTHEPRALGAVMKAMAKAGVIEPTGRWEKSRRPEAHARPVMVWRYALEEKP